MGPPISRRLATASVAVLATDLARGAAGDAVAQTFGRTAAEQAAGIVPASLAYLPGDVRRYGAAADGVTPDRAAVQAAMDAFAAGGAPVFLPGLCFVEGRLLYAAPRGLHMYGNGWDCGLRGARGGDYIILLFQHRSFAAIENVRLWSFRIDGNDGGQLDAGLLQLNNCTGFVLDQLKVGQTTKTRGSSGVNGITASAGQPGGAGPSGTIRDCVVQATSKAGINWTSQSVHVLITGCHVSDITGNGTAPGIQVNGGMGAKIIGNRVAATQGPGIYVNVDNLGTEPLDTIVANNTVTGCGATSPTQGSGIHVTAMAGYAGRLLVTGNSISNSGNGRNGGSGIHVINTGNLLIDGNLCQESRFDGIRIQNCHGVSITNNRCTGNNAANARFAGGIQLRGTCSNVSITGNACTDERNPRTQSYGVILDAEAVLSHLTIVGNHLEGNALGPLLAAAGATPMNLEIVADATTRDGAPRPVLALALPDPGAMLLTVRAVGRQASGAARAAFSKEALVQRSGGDAALAETPGAAGLAVRPDAGWGGVGIGTARGAAVVQVAGKVSTVVDWRVAIAAQTV